MSNMPCSRTPARQSSADLLARLYGDFRRDKGVVPHIETFEAQSLQHSCLRPVGSITLCLTFGITPASPRLSSRWLGLPCRYGVLTRRNKRPCPAARRVDGILWQFRIMFVSLFPAGFPPVPQYLIHAAIVSTPLTEPCLRYLRTRLLTRTLHNH